MTSEFLTAVLLKFQVFWNQQIKSQYPFDVSHCLRLQGQFQLSVVANSPTLEIRALRYTETSVTTIFTARYDVISQKALVFKTDNFFMCEFFRFYFED